jgi:hypothetical protein
MARKMSEINVKQSRYFKVPDLEEMSGQPWQTAQLVLTIVQAFEGMYQATDSQPAEEGFFLQFAGVEKPCGANWTNRCLMQTMVGDVPWDTESLAGIRILVSAHQTGLGVGLLFGPVPNTMQEQASDARNRIDAAIARQHAPPAPAPAPAAPAPVYAPPSAPAPPARGPERLPGPTIPPAAVSASPPAGPASWVDQSGGGTLPEEPSGFYPDDDPGAM